MMRSFSVKLVCFLVFVLSLVVFNCADNSENMDPDDNTDPDENSGPELNKLAVGESSNDLLSDANYDRLTIELVAVDGFELDNTVINSFKEFLENMIHKPQGITIKTSSVTSPGLTPYSASDLRDFEDQIRSEYNNDKELSIFIFITEDSYTNENVLGLAYRNTSFAIMGGRIEELTGGIGQPGEDLVLQTVMRHEMGHLLGLVNVGTDMQTDHQDTSNGHHCDVESCLMYYAVETGDFLSNLVGSSSPPELDNQCKADLIANGGK